MAGTPGIRLLHVVGSGKRRGAEMFAADLVGALNEAGVSQRVAILDSPATLVAFDAPVDLLVRDGWWFPGLRVDVKILRTLRALISGWKPDIVMAHGGDTLKYSVMAGTGLDCRMVYRAIGMAPPWISRGPRRTVYRMLVRRAARIVALAEAVARDSLIVFDCAPERVETIPNAVDASRMTPRVGRRATRQALGIAPNAGVILSIAALTWEKDPLAHLDITAPLLAEWDNLVHLIAGDGPMRHEVETAVRERAPDGRVRVLGSRDDIPDLMAASDVLLFASRSDGMEGLPTIMIEAGLAGLPVAAYDIAGVREVVLDGVTGVLAPPGDRAGLSRSISGLLADSRRRKRYGAAARQHCRAHFEIGVVAPAYLRLYQDLLTRV